MNRFGRLDRGIMNAVDYVGIAKRKRSLNGFGRLDRGIMNAVDYVGIAKRKRSLNRSPGLTVLQPTRSSRAEFCQIKSHRIYKETDNKYDLFRLSFDLFQGI